MRATVAAACRYDAAASVCAASAVWNAAVAAPATRGDGHPEYRFRNFANVVITHRSTGGAGVRAIVAMRDAGLPSDAMDAFAFTKRNRRG